jgi:hypothetical protein
MGSFSAHAGMRTAREESRGSLDHRGSWGECPPRATSRRHSTHRHAGSVTWGSPRSFAACGGPGLVLAASRRGRRGLRRPPAAAGLPHRVGIARGSWGSSRIRAGSRRISPRSRMEVRGDHAGRGVAGRGHRPRSGASGSWRLIPMDVPLPGAFHLPASQRRYPRRTARTGLRRFRAARARRDADIDAEPLIRTFPRHKNEGDNRAPRGRANGSATMAQPGDVGLPVGPFFCACDHRSGRAMQEGGASRETRLRLSGVVWRPGVSLQDNVLSTSVPLIDEDPGPIAHQAILSTVQIPHWAFMTATICAYVPRPAGHGDSGAGAMGGPRFVLPRETGGVDE